MRENALGLTVVTADGRVIRTGGRARKSAAGYDLTRLFVGSEGTLGIITEVQLRLYGIPEAMSAAVCGFGDLVGAVNTVIATIQSGIPVARVELLDAMMVQAVNAYSKLDHAVKPTLFFEFHGTEAGVAEQARMVGEIAEGFGGGDFAWATRAEDRTRLWAARHDAFWALKALRPGTEAKATDVCVPISRLADCVLAARDDAAQAGLLAPILGHVGDGNFHMTFLLNLNDPEEIERAEAVNARMVAHALEVGGTCTGEHGIGSGKIDFLEREHGDAVQVMRAIKRALDPGDILNPGKVLRPVAAAP
jgi:D-lactate dehydrogenase (cytochrome)